MYKGKEREMEVFGTRSQERCPENITVPQHVPGHLWGKRKLAAPIQPAAVLWRKKGHRRAGSPGRKREFWLTTGASGRGVVQRYGQQSAKKIAQVR